MRVFLLFLLFAGFAEGHEGFGVTRVYTWGHALLSQDQFAGGQWSAHFHGHDGQGSVRFLTDTNGVVTDTFDYDAFGNLIARSGTTPNLYLHRGEQFDQDLNLYYLRARYANPATGRFWTADSFEGFATDPASLHHYTFNQNDPVNRIDPSGHISLAETFSVASLAPIVRGAFLSLWDGVNNFSYGMSGGNALKFTSREEAYFIDSLAVGPGWKFGKPNFWAAAKGAPFLLALNPNIWQGRKPCYYDCIPFDQDVPVYGPGAQHPMFEFEQSPIYGLVEKIGYYGTAPTRLIGGAAVAAGVAGKGIAELVVNVGGTVAYGAAADVYGPETADKLFGKQAEATAAMASGLGRLAVAAGTFAYQPLLDVVAPEFAAEQRTLLKNTAKAAFSDFTGGNPEFEGLGWEFRVGYIAFNALGLVTGAGEVAQAVRTARAARLSARLLAAESVAQMSTVRALRVNAAAEAAEAAAALNGPAKAGCRAVRPGPIIDLVPGPDGVHVPVSELKNQKLLLAAKEPLLLTYPKGPLLLPAPKQPLLLTDAKNAPVVVGENMAGRVNPYARNIGGYTIDDWLAGRQWSQPLNDEFIATMKGQGREFIDIGPDFGRRLQNRIDPMLGRPPSSVYGGERRELLNYDNYRRVNDRTGKHQGGVPGLDP